MESYVEPYEAEPKSSPNADPLDLSNLDDLAPVEVPISYKGHSYILVEASADTSVKWRNAVMKATKFSDGKVSSVENMADTEPYLVSMCLTEVLSPSGKRRAMTPQEVRTTFSNRVMKRLYDKVVAISDLKEEPKTLKAKVIAARKDLRKLEAEYELDLKDRKTTEAADSEHEDEDSLEGSVKN